MGFEIGNQEANIPPRRPPLRAFPKFPRNGYPITPTKETVVRLGDFPSL